MLNPACRICKVDVLLGGRSSRPGWRGGLAAATSSALGGACGWRLDCPYVMRRVGRHGGESEHCPCPIHTVTSSMPPHSCTALRATVCRLCHGRRSQAGSPSEYPRLGSDADALPTSSGFFDGVVARVSSSPPVEARGLVSGESSNECRPEPRTAARASHAPNRRVGARRGHAVAGAGRLVDLACMKLARLRVDLRVPRRKPASGARTVLRSHSPADKARRRRNPRGDPCGSHRRTSHLRPVRVRDRAVVGDLEGRPQAPRARGGGQGDRRLRGASPKRCKPATSSAAPTLATEREYELRCRRGRTGR